MSLTIILSFMQYCGAMGFTPGPNNMMLAASGANFGFWRTFPHVMGVGIGYPTMFLVVGLGLGEIFETYPIILQTIKIVGFIYLLYLAYKISQFKPNNKEIDKLVESENANKKKKPSKDLVKPLTFTQAALFQWVNPKAWVGLVTALSFFTSPDHAWPMWMQVVLFTIISLFFAFASASTWCYFGTRIAPLLQSPVKLKIFNYTMALSIIGAAFYASFLA